MRTLRFLSLAALALAGARADVGGVIVNRTTNQPQGGVLVHLMKLGQGGMEPAGSAKAGPDGRFFLKSDTSSPYLLQAVYQGVSYSLQVPPGSGGAVEVAVYDASARPVGVNLTQHMILVETDGKELVVNETFLFDNSGKLTWSDPAQGTLRFSVPAGAGANLLARATSPGGMPVEREPRKAGKDVYALDFPIKPGGETRFDVSYKMPVASPLVLRGRILHGPGPVRLVVPQGMSVEGAGLKALGKEPQTQAAIYEIAGNEYALALSGAGSLRASTPAPTEREEDGPRIERILPPGYGRWWKWALGLAAAFLALSFWAQWLKSPPAGSKPAR